MSAKRIGVVIGDIGSGPDPHSTALLAGIEKAEEMGIPAAWLVTRQAATDPLTLFASAAVRTQKVLLGTCIVPTFPRHPVAMVQQVQVLAQLAPGRFRLGVGPSHRPTMEEIFGVDFRAPMGHLREYLHILKELLHHGSVDFDGRHYTAHARIESPVEVPVMASALQPRALEICGAESDGVISWIFPRPYVRDVALPAMQAGAQKAGHPTPPLIDMLPVCVHEDHEEVRAAMTEQCPHPRLPFYQRLFAAAGFPEAAKGKWSNAMIDAVTLWGDESEVAEQIGERFALGATELLAVPIHAGDDRAASLDRTWRLLAEVSRTMPA